MKAIFFITFLPALLNWKKDYTIQKTALPVQSFPTKSNLKSTT